MDMPDWPAILDEHGSCVWRTAYRIVGNRADADECFQEAFLAALTLSRREPIANWRALLQRLAATRAIDRVRQCRRRGAQENVSDWNDVAGRGQAPHQAAEDQELIARLREVLGQIPPKQAEVFCLYSLEGWNYQEIADQLAISTDSVGVLLHRARARLRKLLASLGVSH
jgi:RNA polymerase sigma-70 factor (ECF subfamily)